VIRVGVVAATLAMRVGLRGLLDENEDVQVVTEAPTLSALEPIPGEIDILVLVADESSSLDLDLLHGDMEGVALLVLTDDDIETAPRLSGHTHFTWGILPIDSTEGELLAAIGALREGLIVGPPHIMGAIFAPSREAEHISSERQPEGIVEPLTQRETQVLQLLSQGLANKQIALSLQISEHTVKFHVSSIYAKLVVTNRTEAVRQGVRHGLVVL
jgi:NarL family two-component system response regulator YdfI